MGSIFDVSVFETVVFFVRMCVMMACSETENLRFCSVLIYVSATDLFLAEKSLRFDEICVT